VTPLVDGRTRQTRDSRESITVVASSGMWADALTKVLAVDRQRGAVLLNRLAAGAVLISGTAAGSNFRVLPSPNKIQRNPSME
jgi:thiamine biosynthesis lipoprotein ApbE